LGAKGIFEGVKNRIFGAASYVTMHIVKRSIAVKLVYVRFFGANNKFSGYVCVIFPTAYVQFAYVRLFRKGTYGRTLVLVS